MLSGKWSWILIVVLVLPLTGCFFSREIANTRRDIESAYPDLRLEKQIVLNLGPLSLRTLGWMTRLVPEDEAEMASRYLRDVSRVKVGVYRAEQPGDFRTLDVRNFGFEKDWEVAVKSRQAGERVWVMYREGAKTVEDLYVVVLSEEELVIARVHGRLERLLARVMEDHVDTWVPENSHLRDVDPEASPSTGQGAGRSERPDMSIASDGGG